MQMLFTLFAKYEKRPKLEQHFCHNDQDVFYKLSQIIWIIKNESIVNMGGFHLLLVALEVFYKK